jgi:hypothetical protein
VAEGGTGAGRPLTLHEAAARHGAYRWVEQRLHELTGRWSGAASVPPDVRVHMFEASAQHAWHAQLWADRLPVLAGMDPATWTRPAGPLLAPLLDALDAAGDGPPPVVGALAALHRVVLPELLASYARHRLALGELADRPAIRALGLVARDEEDELAACARLLTGLTPREKGAADDAVRALEEVLWGAATVPASPEGGGTDARGAIPGLISGLALRDRDLVPWPDPPS